MYIHPLLPGFPLQEMSLKTAPIKFEQIESTGETHINQKGVVFTPYRDAGKILVSYPIDVKHPWDYYRRRTF